MKSVRFKKLDAFAVNGSSGNPAGAVYLDHPDQLSIVQMQTIARELAGFVSEVGFLAPLGPAHYWLRYYSSEREVAFCGHATIALIYDLIHSTPALRAVPRVRLSTKNDNLIVENRVADADCIFVTSPPARFGSSAIDKQSLARVLRTTSADIRDDRPSSVVNAGLETLVVPVRGLEQILAISPDLNELKSFCIDSGIDILILYSDEVANPRNEYRTRVFAPTFGYLEDPATGSGSAALGHYLLANEMWDGSMLSLEQNRWANEPNIVRLLARNNDHGDREVLFGGNATAKIEGEYFLSATRCSGVGM